MTIEFLLNVIDLVVYNVWLAAVPPCVGFEGGLFGGMDSKPLFDDAYLLTSS